MSSTITPQEVRDLVGESLDQLEERISNLFADHDANPELTRAVQQEFARARLRLGWLQPHEE